MWSSTTGELARAYDRFGVLEAEDLGMRSRQVPGGDGLDGLRWPGEAEYLRTKRRIKGLMRAEALAGDEFWMAIGNRSRMIEAFAPTAVVSPAVTGSGRHDLGRNVRSRWGACAGETRSEGAPAQVFFPPGAWGVVFGGKV